MPPSRSRPEIRNAAPARPDAPVTIGALLLAIREGEGLSQAYMSDRLNISRANLCDIEKGRKSGAPARAAKFAKVLGRSQQQFVQLALQEIVDSAGLRFSVDLRPG